MVDHAISELQEERDRMVFQMYIADIGKGLLESIVSACGGKIEVKRYADIIVPQKEETRTAFEIKSSIKEKLGRLVGDEK